MGKDKKQKKKQDKDWPAESDGTETNLLSSLTDRKQSVEKMGKNDNNSDSDSPSINTDVNNVHGESDDEIEIVTLEQQGKKRGKAKAFKGGFDLLNIEGEDNEEMGDEQQEWNDTLELESNTKKSEDKSKKKSKKKERRKKKNEDEDEIDKILEELSLEMSGGKSKEKPKTLENDATKTGDVEGTSENVTKKKKKAQKQDLSQEDDTVKESLDDENAHTVKSAAQKKKEKKEREKAERQKLKQLEKKKRETEGSKADAFLIENDESEESKKLDEESEESKKLDDESEESKKMDDESAMDVVTTSKIEEDIDITEETKEDESTGTKKKKKKKGGTGEVDVKKDKKRPGKKMIAAMQEALRKVQEEEEKFRLKEEARIAAAEEAERLRQEQIQLEIERKERKRQKEKEKKERLKAEGKLLSKTQRQNRARMEATLSALREQGVEVPKIGERFTKPRDNKEKSRKGFNKKKNVVKEVEVVAPEVIAEKEADLPLNDIEPTPLSEEEEKVKESWYDTSDEDEPMKPQSVVKVFPEHVPKDKKHVAEKGESSSEDESSEEESESTSSSESEDEAADISSIEAVRERIKRRREVAESKRSLTKLRSPVVCVLGHVDTGKTKILDKIRNTSVQLGESGGITQQIGATMVPAEAIREQCKFVKNFSEMELQIPGLLIIDTPGHESFSNLRSRGSSLCDIAILVVDINHGLEQQTIESINLLKQKKTPFVIALNKIDRLYEWKSTKNKDVHDIVKNQVKSTRLLFDDRVKQIILEFANQSLNVVPYYDNKDPRTYISMVPTSALAGDGMGNLMALVAELTQKMMALRLQFSEDLQATVLEVKAIGGLGHTMDVILVNGRLREGDTIVYAGFDGPMTTQIRSLLMPQPLKELRVKTQFIEHKEIEGAQGIKIAGKDLEKAIAGLPLLVPCRADEIPLLKEEIGAVFKETMNAIKTVSVGVYVQASTLGSLEALMEFLSASKIPVCGVRIGPVSKRDVMKCSVMLEHGPLYGVILAFDVKIEKEAQELADSSNIKIFSADIIYHLFDMYTNFAADLKEKAKDLHKNEAIFPCKLRILPQFIFNSRDPIICGVIIEAGCVKEGTPLCVPSKECLDIGIVTTIESNHKALPCARKGQEVCIKIENLGGDAPKMFGRHFDHTDMLVSKISRQSIDMCKKYFRDDLQKSDWQLMLELKSTFAIM